MIIRERVVLQRLSEAYAVDCHRCGLAIDIPAGAVVGDSGACPSCRAPITLQWRGGATDYELERQAKRRQCQQCRRPLAVPGLRFCSEACRWAARVDRVLELVGTAGYDSDVATSTIECPGPTQLPKFERVPICRMLFS